MQGGYVPCVILSMENFSAVCSLLTLLYLPLWGSLFFPPCSLSGELNKARKGFGPFAQAVKKPRRAREGQSPLTKNRARRRVRRARVLIFAPGNPISQSKNRFLAIFACVAKRREQKLEGVAGGAESAGFCGFALQAKLPRLKLKI